VLFCDGETSGIYVALPGYEQIREVLPAEVGILPNSASFLKPLNLELAVI
jgi:hypothetical protein